jgi:hypothetical protein
MTLFERAQEDLRGYDDALFLAKQKRFKVMCAYSDATTPYSEYEQANRDVELAQNNLTEAVNRNIHIVRAALAANPIRIN